jgi:hypothetical protein
MANIYQGLNQRIAAYAVGGGTEANHFALGWNQAGRYGESSEERDPAWSSNQRDAYNKGLADRRADDAGLVGLPPPPMNAEGSSQ